MKHHDEGVARNCLHFLKNFPLVAWVRGYDEPSVMGSVVDLLAFEAMAAFDSQNATVLDVRNAVIDKIFQLGSGLEAIAPFMEEWSVIRPWVLQRAKQSMATVAISRSSFTGNSRAKVRDLLNGRPRSADDVARQFDALQMSLANDILLRGDKRLTDPGRIATLFVASVKSEASDGFDMVENPTLQLLKAQDIDLAEIDDNTTMEDIGNLATFRAKLRIANKKMNLPWPILKARVEETNIPSGVIQGGLRRHGQDHREWKGSDLTDAYLACLSPYADITYVDKRTLENFTRARRKSSDFAALARRVARAAHYLDIASQLDER